MHNANTSTKRVLWLISNELRLKKNLYSIILGACFAVLTYLFFNPEFKFGTLLDSIINPINSGNTYNPAALFINTGGGFVPLYLKYHLTYFPKALYLVGFIVTSLAFTEYADERSRRFFVALPASQIEKWLAKVLWTAVLFPLCFYLLYQVFSLITYRWGTLSNHEYVRIAFFDPFIWKQIILYSALQCLVFLGAVFFHKNAFVKVLLIGLGTYFFIVLFLNLVIFSMFPDFDLGKMGGYFNKDGYVNYLMDGKLEISKKALDLIPEWITNLPSVIWCYIIALTALGISFLRFKEIEA